MSQPLGSFLEEDGQGFHVVLVGIDLDAVDASIGQNLVLGCFKLVGLVGKSPAPDRVGGIEPE